MDKTKLFQRNSNSLQHRKKYNNDYERKLEKKMSTCHKNQLLEHSVYVTYSLLTIFNEPFAA